MSGDKDEQDSVTRSFDEDLSQQEDEDDVEDKDEGVRPANDDEDDEFFRAEIPDK